MNPTDPTDVIRTTHLLKSKTSTGIDNISSKIIKDTISEIAEPLAHIFNLSFSTGMVPADMKIGKITPIYK